MVHSCCAVGCTNRGGKDSVSFYRFPANEEQRQKWTAAVKRDGWQPTSATRLCSAHFAKGKRDSNPLSPDFVPSIFNHTPSQMRLQKIREMETFERRRKMRRGMREVASSMGGPASTAEEFNTSIISGEGDATLQNQSDIMDQDETLPFVKSVDRITAQSVTAPVDVAVSTVWDHDYSTIQSEKICKLRGHIDEAWQFPSDALLDKAHNIDNKTSVSSTMTDISHKYIKSRT